jgi:DNA ligase (NAD+)
MNKKEAKKRIQKLKKVIKHHRYLYHVQDKQEISEDALDSLKHELYELEQEYPEFITSDSPTQRIGGEPLEEFKKVEHDNLMLSIEDVFSLKELEQWENYLKRLTDKSFNYFSELKIDGLALSLIYEDGFLIEGSTRGNGRVGEDVTKNIKTIESIPLKLKYYYFKEIEKKIQKEIKNKIKKGRIEVRGEVYIGKEEFQELNKEMEKKGEKTFSNPRNLAAGTIRQLDPKIVSSRPLQFLAYSLETDLKQKKHSKEHDILLNLGFKSDEGRKCSNLEEVFNYWEEVKEKREKYSFQIDGVVVNVNDNEIFNQLGRVGKSPRGVRAFKFPPLEATTIVEDVKLQVGRTGAITPVAILKPVEIEGVVVSRATLHNFDEIKRLDLKINDTVSVARAGDVIPTITKVFKKLRTGKEKEISLPKKCPSCGIELEKTEEVVWRCPNPNCFDRKRRSLHHFASKGGFDIVGLGPKIIDKLIENNLVSNMVDLFNLKKGDLISLEGFSEKAAQNLLDSIKNSKEINLNRFIFALGIRNVGEQTARDLVEHFSSLKELKRASQESLEEIEDIGPIVAKSIVNFFDKEKNWEMIQSLKEEGIKIKTLQETGKLKGLNFVLTGSLKSMTRGETKKEIRKNGGEVSSSISSKVNYLVVGEKPGSKLKKAKEKNIKILQEKEFLKML